MAQQKGKGERRCLPSCRTVSDLAVEDGDGRRVLEVRGGAIRLNKSSAVQSVQRSAMESRDRIRHHNRQQERDAGQYLLGDCVECAAMQ